VTSTLSRRALLIGTGAALALTATGMSAAAKTTSDPVTAYHGVSGATHQQRFNELSAQGYRMISLSVYGDPANPQYAAVWVKRAGPGWAAVHGVDAAGYQAKFDQFVAAGMLPVLVSATGPRAKPVFAAVFEQQTAPTWMARHGLVDGPESTAGTLANVTAWAKANNCIPKTIAIYGGAGDRTYAGVWLPNTVGVKWQSPSVGDGNAYQAAFNAYTQVPLRVASVDASDALRYAAVFTDDSVGPWVARHGLTSADYQAEFDKQVALGRYPISVQGGGSASDVRYAAVFAGQDQPVARAWTQIDAVGAGYTGVHAVMRDLMRGRGIRAGQLAVRKNGVLKLSTGYTWAEPGYALTQPSSLMRVASVSKAFTCAAIRKLVNDGKLNLNQAVFPLLGITSVALPSQIRDPRIDSVTVRNCVDHTGGWVRRVSGVDPVFRTRDFARALKLPGRASKRDVARYMYGEPLQYTPGDSTTYDSDDRYSNFGYVLLGLVVEQVTGKPFVNSLAANGPVAVGATLHSGRQAGEVTYDESGIGSSAWDPYSDTSVPGAYGNFLVEAMDSGGGLITTAPAVTSLISTNAVWGLGGRAPGYARSGSMPGTSSYAMSRSDGIDWCYILNASEIFDAPATLAKLATDLNTTMNGLDATS
jgi:CubicO group peptidase (beta-lactamase class C family)